MACGVGIRLTSLSDRGRGILSFSLLPGGLSALRIILHIFNPLSKSSRICCCVMICTLAVVWGWALPFGLSLCTTHWYSMCGGLRRNIIQIRFDLTV